jgi:hypothetical protein
VSGNNVVFMPRAANRSVSYLALKGHLYQLLSKHLKPNGFTSKHGELIFQKEELLQWAGVSERRESNKIYVLLGIIFHRFSIHGYSPTYNASQVCKFIPIAERIPLLEKSAFPEYMQSASRVFENAFVKDIVPFFKKFDSEDAARRTLANIKSLEGIEISNSVYAAFGITNPRNESP